MTEPNTPRGSVEALFHPRSIAVVGASPTRRSARQPLQNLLNIGYTGQVAAVNPRYDEVLGVSCYESVAMLPFVPDALAVVVNNTRVVPIIEEAAARGVRAAVVFGMGFGESGPEGVERQGRLVEVARSAGMAVVGPNCMGMINFVDSSPLFIEHLEPGYVPGRVGLIAQSGSMMMALTNNKRGVRWSHAVSSGNEAVTDAADLMAFFVDDPATDVICLFVESVRAPERFFAECDRAFSVGKPVIMLKAGRSAAGASVVAAHSGALAQPDSLVSALLARHRVIRVDSMEELLQTAIALQSKVRPSSNRLATLAPSGAQIELVLDEADRQGLRHEPLAENTQTALTRLLPEFLLPRNPLDWWGLPDYTSTFVEVLDTVAADPDIDIVVNLTDFSNTPTGRDNQFEQVEFTTSLRPSGKVVAVLENLDGAVRPDVVQRGLDAGVLVLSGIPAGFRALRHLIDYSEPAREPAIQLAMPGRASEAMQGLTGPMSGDEGLDFLRRIGLSTVRSDVVEDVDAAVSSALTLDFPVVVKSADAEHAHKTELGAVRVGLGDAQAVKEAATDLFALGARSLLVQEQVVGGVELILGLKTHPQLGTFVLVGMGGIWTEVMADVAIRPVGLRVGEAEDMLRSLRGHPLLYGGRGTARLCVDKVVEMIERVDALGATAGHLIEALDINPVIVTLDDAVAVDALVVGTDGSPGEPS